MSVPVAETLAAFVIVRSFTVTAFSKRTAPPVPPSISRSCPPATMLWKVTFPPPAAPNVVSITTAPACVVAELNSIVVPEVVMSPSVTIWVAPVKSTAPVAKISPVVVNVSWPTLAFKVVDAAVSC